MTQQVLITGADGYVGRKLAQLYLENTSARLSLVLRASGVDEARAKRQRMAQVLEAYPADRIDYVHSDLASDRPLDEVDPANVTTIVHAAAVTRFNVERELAEQVNVDGAKKVLAFADRCPRLESFGLLSTVYSSGLLPGALNEVPAPSEHGFANNYEWSKREAEAAALSGHPNLPLRIIRIATLLADDDSGRVTQYNAFHNTLKLYYYGLLSLIPGKADTPVYLVTGDFVAQSVFRLLRSSSAAGIYHVAHEQRYNPTLGELIDQVFDLYEQHDDFRMKRILRPLFTDDESFEVLAAGINSFSGAVTRQALQSMTPFARQLYVSKSLDNSRMREELPDYTPPDHFAQLRRTLEHVIHTKWGRNNDPVPGRDVRERKAEYAV